MSEWYALALQARTCESNRSCRQSLLNGAEVKRGMNPGKVIPRTRTSGVL